MIDNKIKTVKNCSKEKCLIQNIHWFFDNIYNIYIIKNLMENKVNRFSCFKKEINNICDATLAKNLKILESEDIIKKEVLKTFPPTTNYYLTQKGKELKKILTSIEKYSTKYPSKNTK